MKWLFLAFFSSSFAQAGIGPSLPLDEIFQQQCFMDYGLSKSRFDSICTGILIDSTQILTAAHCVADERPHTITCGPNAEIVEIESVQIHPQFQKSVIIENVAHLAKDLAVIRLKVPVPAVQVQLKSIDDLSEAKRCAFFGYSKLSLRSREIAPIPQFGWQISKNALEMWSEYQILRLNGLMAPGGLSEVGDSGGPLMCEIDGEWTLLGIASSRDFSYHSLFSPVKDKAFPITTTSDPKLELIAKRQSKEFILRGQEKEKEALLKSIRRIKKISWIAEESSSDEYPAIYLKALKHLFDKPGQVGRLKPFSTFKKQGDQKIYSVGDLSYNYFEIESIDFDSSVVKGNLKVLGPSDVFTCGGDILCRDEVITGIATNLDNLLIYYMDEMP